MMGQSQSLPIPFSPSDPDPTLLLPDDILAAVFDFLPAADRKRCSLVCRRWRSVDAFSRRRLSVDARAAAAAPLLSLLSRFSAVSRLALRCDRRHDSIGDDSLVLVASHLGGRLERLKLRALRCVTDSGIAELSSICRRLTKLSIGSCALGVDGLSAVFENCNLLQELSVKRLRGIGESDKIDAAKTRVGSLWSLSLKELYNGQCFEGVIAKASSLRVLKIIRCSGSWDQTLETLPKSVSELRLEKLQVSDRGLQALSGLEVLHLVKAPECTDSGLAAVASRCPKLRKLHLDGWRANRIGDAGLSAVARSCPALQELVLIGVNLTAASLALVAGCCSSLERLALCGSDTFGDAEMKCVAVRCTALRKLCIKACPILSDIGMEALAAGGCPRLVKVKVKKCRGVTHGFAERLWASRHGALSVNFDVPGAVSSGTHDAGVDESGLENAGSELVPDSEDNQWMTASELHADSRRQSSSWSARIGMSVAMKCFGFGFRRRMSHSTYSHDT